MNLHTRKNQPVERTKAGRFMVRVAKKTGDRNPFQKLKESLQNTCISESTRKTTDDQLKIDLHVHTRRSPDGAHSLRSMVKYARKIGLDGIAITDHNKLLSKKIAREISREFGILVIPGIEGGNMISGKHWLGLFIDTLPIDAQISEIIKKIRNEGGISIAPHPYTRQGYHDFNAAAFDAVEGLNGTTARSDEIFKQKNHQYMPITAGSDAHAIPMLGYTWTRIDAEKNIDDILEAIQKGRCVPEGTLIPFIHRHMRFYISLTIRHLASCPAEFLSFFRDSSSCFHQINQEI